MAKSMEQKIIPLVESKPDKVPGGIFSDRDRALVLSVIDFHGGNVQRAHRYLKGCGWNISYDIMRQWKNGSRGINSHVEQLRANASKELVYSMEFVLEIATRRILSMLDEASFRELIGTVSVLTEKVQLLKELPTARVEHTGFLHRFNHELELMTPGGDGAEDSQRELPEATEITVQPVNGAGVAGEASAVAVGGKAKRNGKPPGSRAGRK